jgi:rare lipoprotein A
MKKISILVFAIYTASLWIPRHAAAQAYPAPAGDTFRQEGIASWYGTEFDGRPTASGEIFNSSMLTAAHPSLPFGTYLLVTNRHNNRQVTVRINDRGPFVPSRIIDVSRAAAEQLDMLVTGTAPVLIEAFQTVQNQQPPALPPVYQPQPAQPQAPAYQQPPVYSPIPAQPQPPAYSPPAQQPQVVLVPTPPETPAQGTGAPITVTIYPPIQAAPPAPPATVTAAAMPPEIIPSLESPPQHAGARLIPAITPSPGRTYRLQVGSYKDARNAVNTYARLREAGLNPEYERYGDFYRVVLKNIRGTDVQSVVEKLEMTGFHEAIAREE